MSEPPLPLFQLWNSAPSLFWKHQNPLKFFWMPILQYLHISVKLELIGLVANSKIALGHSRLCCLKSHLVTCQPALVAKHQGSTYRRTGDIKIHVAAHVDVFPFVSRLNFSTLFPKAKGKNLTSLQRHSGGNSIKSVTLTPRNRLWRWSIRTWRVRIHHRLRFHVWKKCIHPQISRCNHRHCGAFLRPSELHSAEQQHKSPDSRWQKQILTTNWFLSSLGVTRE